MKTQTPEEIAAAALAALAAFVAANRGAIDALAKRLSARTGQTIYRQYVSQWLSSGKTKHVEPKLGIGLLLIEEGQKLMAESRNGTATGQSVPKVKAKQQRK